MGLNYAGLSFKTTQKWSNYVYRVPWNCALRISNFLQLKSYSAAATYLTLVFKRINVSTLQHDELLNDDVVHWLSDALSLFNK